MLCFALLVIPMGYSSILFFLGFACGFFLLSYSYSWRVLKFIFRGIVKLFNKFSTEKNNSNKKKTKNIKVNNKLSTSNFKKICSQEFYYDKKNKKIKINTKEYDINQLVSVDLIINSKKNLLKEIKNIDKIKSLEIKIGTKVKKVTYRSFKYINAKDKNVNIDKLLKNAISDYKKISKLKK